MSSAEVVGVLQAIRVDSQSTVQKLAELGSAGKSESAPTRDRTDELVNAIKQTSQNTAQMVAEVGSVGYFVGLFISMGMNFALGNGLGALLLCLLSWANVGYVAVGLATGAYDPQPPAS